MRAYTTLTCLINNSTDIYSFSLLEEKMAYSHPGVFAYPPFRQQFDPKTALEIIQIISLRIDEKPKVEFICHILLTN